MFKVLRHCMYHSSGTSYCPYTGRCGAGDVCGSGDSPRPTTRVTFTSSPTAAAAATTSTTTAGAEQTTTTAAARWLFYFCFVNTSRITICSILKTVAILVNRMNNRNEHPTGRAAPTQTRDIRDYMVYRSLDLLQLPDSDIIPEQRRQGDHNPDSDIIPEQRCQGDHNP